MKRRGSTLVEVLVALMVVAVQLPAIVATVAAAAALTRQAETLLAKVDDVDLVDRCRRP